MNAQTVPEDRAALPEVMQPDIPPTFHDQPTEPQSLDSAPLTEWGRRFLSGVRAQTQAVRDAAGRDEPATPSEIPARELADPNLVEEMLYGLISTAEMAGSWAVELRTGRARTLRPMTPENAEDLATAAAAIAARHVPAHLLHPDLVDLIRAGNALGSHLREGPLTMPLPSLKSESE